MEHFVAEQLCGGSLRPLKRNTGLEPLHDDQPPVVGASRIVSPINIQSRNHGNGKKKVLTLTGGEAGKARIGDAHNRERHTVQGDAAAHGRAVTTEFALPEAITQDDGGHGGKRIVFPPQGAAGQSIHAER